MRKLGLRYEKIRYVGGNPAMDTFLFAQSVWISVFLSGVFGLYRPFAFYENILSFLIIPLATVALMWLQWVIIGVAGGSLFYRRHPKEERSGSP